MDSVISPSQHAFIKGSLILDYSLLANECFDASFKERTVGLVCKVDMEKAYNHVSWDFLNNVMIKMGLVWNGSIVFVFVCILSVSYSILVNGCSKGIFHGNRGRQGEPLSPLLFNMVMDVLSCLVAKAESLGLLVGCKVGLEAPSMPLVQFANNSFFFLQANVRKVQNLRSILLMFEANSGLRVNLSKSKLTGVGPMHNL